MRTMKELCQEAIDIQTASNLSGVVHAFSRAMTDLRTLLDKDENFSTEMLNRHHVSILFSDKIASLTGSEHGVAFSNAYGFAKRQTEGIE